jgi:hypothetical protein
LEEYAIEGITLSEKMKRWNTYRLLNILNLLKGDLPDDIKTHLFRFPDQIENIAQINKFLKPIQIDDFKCKPSIYPPE